MGRFAKARMAKSAGRTLEDDLVIASFTSGPGATTLPMRLYSQVGLGVNPEINAISTLPIVVVTLG